MKTYYDLWVQEEKKKIHAEFENKRQELFGKLFVAGLNEKSKDDVDIQAISSELKNLDAQEQELISQFESDPGGTEAKFMEYVRANQSEGK